MDWLFGSEKPVTLREKVRGWVRELQRQKRVMERDAQSK